MECERYSSLACGWWLFCFFFSSRRRHTRLQGDWSSDLCSSDLLATNLVLGLNSISEVTVNTTSYAVDQGRYGASQITYLTKSGTNSFHGNLYELWNGSKLNAADFFTNATPGNHKPRSTVNHFGGSLGGPVRRNRLFFFTDFEQLRIALPIVTPVTVP